VPLSERTFRSLLRCFPADYRHAYGEELLQFFRDRWADEVRERGRLKAVLAWPAIIFDIIKEGVAERWSHLLPATSHQPGPGQGPSLLNDIRLAFRSLRKSPGFAAVGILTLGIGIGANTAIFSVVDGVLFHQLPYDNADRVVRLWDDKRTEIGGSQRQFGNVTVADFNDWRSQTSTFDELTSLRWQSATLTGTADALRLVTAQVNANFFDVLGVSAQRGRTFRPEEERAEAVATVILSHGLWQRAFGGDESQVGSTILLDGEPVTVVGIMPASFEDPFGEAVDAWRPSNHQALADDAVRSRRFHLLKVLGLRKAEASLEQARVDMLTIAQRLEQTHGETNQGHLIYMLPLQGVEVMSVQRSLWLLLGAVVFVLLIACTTIANLLLSRTLSRRQEFVVRAAMGANAGRLARQVLTENMVLAGLGGVAGLLIAWGGTRALVKTTLSSLPYIDDIGISLSVVLSTVGAVLVTGLLCGLIPALLARKVDLHLALTAGGRTTTEGADSARIRGGLVTAQVGLAVVLLVGCGLMLRSFLALQSVDPGFEPELVVTYRINLPPADYPEAVDRLAFRHEFLERLRELPMVQHAGQVWSIPIGNNSTTSLRPEGDESGTMVGYNAADADYFKAMGIPLIRGRLPDSRDTPDSPGVIVINETVARQHWPDGDPLGAMVQMSPDTEAPYLEVIGVVGDIRREGLAVTPMAEAYEAMPQVGFRGVVIVAKVTGPADGYLDAARTVARSLDPALPFYSIWQMDDLLARTVAPTRELMTMLAMFATMALLLAAMGVYGVTAYAAASRVPEFGVRMALGAQPRNLFVLVARRGLLPVLLGVTIGVVVAVVLADVMASLVYAVTTTDPVVLLAVPALLAVVGFVAGLLPARRAARLDPAAALRAE
jgi:putative ABC transport system permease protein